MQLVAHQGRAGMAVDDLFHRATEIDVDKGRAAIGVELARLRHNVWLAAGELDGHRLLLRAAPSHRQGLAGVPGRPPARAALPEHGATPLPLLPEAGRG